MKTKLSRLGIFLCLPFFSIAQVFTEISQSAGIDHIHLHPDYMGGGVACLDYDNDGFPDLYFTGGYGMDRLYRNDGTGSFTDVTLGAGFQSTENFVTLGVVTGDIDNDGFRDIFLATDAGYPNALFRNNGNGTFTDIGSTALGTDTLVAVSATFGDYNLDGFLDLYVVNYFDFPPDPLGKVECIPNNLYINNGDFTFTDMAVAYGVADSGCGLAVAFTDYDRDHDMDIYIANDFGMLIIPNILYQNNYPGSGYTDVSAASGADFGMFGMGIAIGDYDEDQDFDYYVTNIGKNVLLQNNGNGTFTDTAGYAGVADEKVDTLYATGWSTAFLDYDHDTYLDLFVINGFVPALTGNENALKNPNRLYKNNGNGKFQDVSFSAGVSDSALGRGFAYGDIDNDGDLDLVVSNVSLDTLANRAPVTVYRNDLTGGGHWIKIKTVGQRNNRDGFGAFVEVKAGGRTWIREVDGGSGHLSHNSSIVHVGLANHNMIDTIIITWPGGCAQMLTQVSADQTITVVEDLQNYELVVNQPSLCEGDSMWLGGAYRKQPGTYYDTLSAVLGCDTVVSSQLMVYDPSYTLLDTMIPYGGLFRGHQCYNDTTVIDTFVSYHGCDSIVTAHITIGDPVSISQLSDAHHFSLFPNPCRDRVDMRLHLRSASAVELVVYNVLGEQVSGLLASGYHPAGSLALSWDLKDPDGKKLTPGIYYYAITTNQGLIVSPVVLTR